MLERAGLISRSRTAHWRPCKLEVGPLQEVSGWVVVYRKFWEQSLDRMEEYLKGIEERSDDGGRN